VAEPLPLLDVRVLTGGASSGLRCGFGLVGSPDALPCRPDDALPSVAPPAAGADLSAADFFEPPPPNSRLKNPGLLSLLLDICLRSTSGHAIRLEFTTGLVFCRSVSGRVTEILTHG